MASAARSTSVVYERRRPERTTLYEVVCDNVETLCGAIDDGAIAIRRAAVRNVSYCSISGSS
ncbi:hypothetical protein BE11_19665 [Sorangium cellulosum]|nr:hypothetical protein BE11_19665 [Sorangium cellulosum]